MLTLRSVDGREIVEVFRILRRDQQAVDALALRQVRAAVQGPPTAAPAEARGWKNPIVANPATFEGLGLALTAALGPASPATPSTETESRRVPGVGS